MSSYKSSCLFVGMAAIMIGDLVSLATSRPRIALATTTIKVPELNTTNFDAVQLQGPAVDLGVEHLQRTYGATFNFSHTYLMDPSRPTVPLLVDDVYNFAAKFIFDHADADARVFLSCKRGRGQSTEWNPQRFSLSLTPSPQSFKFIYALLIQNNWTNVAGLVDTRSIDPEYFSRGNRAVFLANFNGKNPALKYIRYNDLVYDSNKGFPAVERALTTLAETSRIVFLFGSGKASMMVLRAAETLGMTNGEYVFFLLTWSRYGMSLDRQDDAWWRVTDATANLTMPMRGYVSRATVVISFGTPYVEGLTPPLRELRQRIVAAARDSYNLRYSQGLVPTFLYGAVEMYMIYGMILNETFNQTGRVLDGVELGSLLRNRTFRLPTANVSFSANGERDIDVIGEVLDPITGDYKLSFVFDAQKQTLNEVSNMTALWPGGLWPPPNEPLCGYFGNSCKVQWSKTSWTLLASISTAVVILAAICTLVAARYLRPVSSTWWLICDIDLTLLRNFGQCDSRIK
ncbi:hypothetical protein BV898_14362 [Hypsibius exemplaris]|uniref:Receptor ligand binding region domain-containing protein n=1 Tax=Hypsibius exemplaris TaxID=2072580 RepID=A0A9X6N8R8_HYPEX|nr:hypothetical protein BV898_14362 [Hypsibius exemplaris]